MHIQEEKRGNKPAATGLPRALQTHQQTRLVQADVIICTCLLYVELPIHVQVYDVSYSVVDHLCIILLVQNNLRRLSIAFGREPSDWLVSVGS